MRQKEKNIFPIELGVENLGFRSREKERAFLRKKAELIKRDPLTKELIEKLKSFVPPQKPSQEIISIKEELERKWRVEIFFTKEERYWAETAGKKCLGSDKPLKILQGFFRGDDGLDYATKTEVLKAYRLNSETQRDEKTYNLQPRGILPTDDKLIIEIDLNLVDRGDDAKFLKKKVLDLIDSCLEQRNREGRKAVVIGEAEELSFLYHCRENSFQNYLRWYDIHSEHKLNFRTMAHIEEASRKGRTIAPAENLLEKLKGNKIKWGKPIKGEDRIEKGVKIIYSAIHRKAYTPEKVESVMNEWNCPEHGNYYFPECEHCRALVARFDQIYPLKEGYRPSKDPKQLSELQDIINLKHQGKLPRKPTRSFQKE